MTREEAKQLQPVIQAFSGGKTIQFSQKKHINGKTWLRMLYRLTVE